MFNISSKLATPARLTQLADYSRIDKLEDRCGPLTTGVARGDEIEGEYVLWQDCEPDGALALQLFTINESTNGSDYLAYLLARMVDQRDITALGVFFSELEVNSTIETPRPESTFPDESTDAVIGGG